MKHFVVQLVFLVYISFPVAVHSITDMKILYDKMLNRASELLSIRPAADHRKPIILYMNLSLTQILDVDEKNQIVIFNMWVWQEWKDSNMFWDPLKYDNVTELRIPSTKIWTPDLVLYNNAGGEWNLASSSTTKVVVNYRGDVQWKPPIIFESQCDIEVEFFPFDTQNCKLKLGTWTHNGYLIDLRHTAQKQSDIDEKLDLFDKCTSKVDHSIDLSDFVENVEWDLLGVPAERNIIKYPCCDEAYPDLTFYVQIRRRTLFYGINLICPCLTITFLSILVFYLPAESGEKMVLSISILISLTVFFLLIFEISPPTSKVVPLILKFLIFTMVLVTFSVMATVVVLNIYWRSPDTHNMSPWMRRTFTKTLPKLLLMKKPETERKGREIFEFYQPLTQLSEEDANDSQCLTAQNDDTNDDWKAALLNFRLQSRRKAAVKHVSQVELALEGVRAIASHMRREDERSAMRDDWRYVAVVLDRLFLWIFATTAIIGVVWIFCQAPSLTDFSKPLSAEKKYFPKITSRNCTLKGKHY